jgi:hypothetical protein
MGALLSIAAFIGALALAGAIGISAGEEKNAPLEPQLGARKKGVKGRLSSFRTTKVPWYDVKHGKLVQKTSKKGEPLFRSQVIGTPSELKAQAEAKLGRKIGDSAFALATMIASEEGSASPIVKGAIANTAWNYARIHDLHVEELLTRGAGSEGTFGSQQGGRYASTDKPPGEEDLLIAEAVLDGRLPDITGGAQNWDSPKAQRELIAQGTSGYPQTNTPEAVAKKRTKAGLVPFYLPNTDPDKLRFWKPAARA